jgi:SHS2 domain-containing protein
MSVEGRMERYRILPHTADGKFEAFGGTLEEAFGNAALALASLMWDWSKIAPRIEHPVRVDGNDKEQLLVKFLGEVIYLFETRQFLLGQVRRLEINSRSDGFGLEAVLAGERLASGHEIYGDVKAVTYHELAVEEGGPGERSRVQVVVDM